MAEFGFLLRLNLVLIINSIELFFSYLIQLDTIIPGVRYRL